MHLSEIFLEGNELYLNRDGELLNKLDGFSKINIFVGSNNSGKSRLLRDICSKNERKFNLKDKKVMQLLSDIRYVLTEFSVIFNLYKNNIADRRSIGETQINKNTVITDIIPDHYSKNIQSEFNTLINTTLSIENMKEGSYQGNSPHKAIITKRQRLINDNENVSKSIENIKKFKNNYKIPQIVYIPIIRTLNYLNDSVIDNKKEIDILKDRFKKIYKFDESIEIFTGQGLYESIKKMLLGTKHQRKVIKNFENFLKSEFFDGQEITLIPENDSDVLLVSIGQIEKRIFDLGDGIQSIIIISFVLFLYEQEGAWIFIEEPELNLHPSMQRKFIEVMLKFPNHQYRLTTHSNHLLDLTMDYNSIAIYKFIGQIEEGKIESVNKFKVEQVVSGDESVLQTLGVQNSSVFLSNCTIWVEGITDRIYIREYLKLYFNYMSTNKKPIFKEDIDYSFVEYGGNNITHWSFLEGYTNNETINVDRLCGKLLLIVDNDSDKKTVRKDFLKDKLEDHFIELECIEIENLLPIQIVKDCVKEYEGDPVIFKNTTANLETTRLGRYIEDYLLETTTRRGGYKEDSGTIKDKLGFCKKAVKYINQMKYEELPIQTQVLVKKIYEFIKSNKQ